MGTLTRRRGTIVGVRRSLGRGPSPLAGVGLGLVLVGVVTAAITPVRGHVTLATPALALVLPVVLAAMAGGRVAALTTAIAAAAALNLALIPPPWPPSGPPPPTCARGRTMTTPPGTSCSTWWGRRPSAWTGWWPTCSA